MGAALADIPLSELRSVIDSHLEAVANEARAQGGLSSEAAAESLVSPGKRIRPVVTLLAAQALGGTVDVAMRPAIAIEMIHVASLILDDMPCMDDAQVRRGRPACHVRFGEDIALLAAFGLLNEAYAILGSCPGVNAEARLALVRLCSEAVGYKGLIGGQEKDIRGSDTSYEDTHGEKTGALFVAAAKAGAIVVGGSRRQTEALGNYAAHLGMAFQALDDFVDVFSTRESAGKEVRHDGASINVVSIVGRDRAMKELLRHVQDAVSALESCGPRAEPLGRLATSLVDGAHALTGSLPRAVGATG